MKKCIITVVGKDKVGIIAGVCQYLSDISVNILNISQTIVAVSYTHLDVYKRQLRRCPVSRRGNRTGGSNGCRRIKSSTCCRNPVCKI